MNRGASQCAPKQKKEETTMERKIGEIFEYNGEWYQCVEGRWCRRCDFHRTNLGATQCNYRLNCFSATRKDNKPVIFKKLEKVGEPFSDYCPSGRVIYFQSYKCYQKPIYTGNMIYWADDTTISIEIKENMEENKLNLKPFDLEAAKLGKPVYTRDGRKARIICFDAKGDKPIIALVEMGTAETPNNYPIDGKAVSTKEASCDLMMLTEKKEGWVNVYKDGLLDTKSYPTKKEAFDRACPEDYVDTVKVCWEE